MTRKIAIPIINQDLKIKEAPRLKSIPNTFKVGREAQLQMTRVEGDLFSDLEEKGKGGYVISGLTQKVSEYDLSSFSFAIQQLLYNQSYQYGNSDTNSGTRRDEASDRNQLVNGKTYMGTIVTTLSDLCKSAYGVKKPSFEQKTAMAALVDTIHETPVKVTYSDGTIRKSYLCSKVEDITDEKTEVRTYILHLNPIFSMDVANNFAELPQDFMFRLTEATKKKTASHLRLARFLSLQDRRKPCTRYITELVAELRMENAYKTNRGRTEKQLKDLFETMIKVKLLSKYEIKEKISRGKSVMDKVVFYYDANFLPRTTAK